MRKFLTTGLFSAILGIVIGGAPADAALVSRGFLDEALENYATTTALDLKANQSDFTDLSNKIGELPSGSLIGNSPSMDSLFEFTQNTDTPVFPNSLSDLINQLYGSNERPGAITALLEGFYFDGYYVGVLPAMSLAETANSVANTANETATAAKTAADTNTAKIGTLPSGNFPDFPESENLFSWLRQPHTYPTSLAELITAIYGNSETSAPGLLGYIITGFPFGTDSDGSFEESVGLIPNFYIAKDANDLANANAIKIGTLPTEYATVGAALTAIKGIAEEAKAAALAAIPDPKTEGSTGKFVLTVDIVGDNATYRWEKIDREGETTTTE